MKDPLLLEYTPEELMYEYLDHTSRAEFVEEKQKEEQEALENDKLDEAMRWAEEEEAKDRAAQQALETKQETPTDLTPEDVKWMEEQLIKEKAEFGDDFGENFSGEF